jgi:hypothetical protein
VGALPCMPLCGEGFAARVDTTQTIGLPYCHCGRAEHRQVATLELPYTPRQAATLYLPCSRSVRGNDQDKQATLQLPCEARPAKAPRPSAYPTPTLHRVLRAVTGAGGRKLPRHSTYPTAAAWRRKPKTSVRHSWRNHQVRRPTLRLQAAVYLVRLCVRCCVG